MRYVIDSGKIYKMVELSMGEIYEELIHLNVELSRYKLHNELLKDRQEELLEELKLSEKELEEDKVCYRCGKNPCRCWNFYK